MVEQTLDPQGDWALSWLARVVREAVVTHVRPLARVQVAVRIRGEHQVGLVAGVVEAEVVPNLVSEG